VCETINIVPASFFIERRIDETVACPNDDTIVSAPPPPAIVERGKLGDTLIVEATADKFIEHQRSSDSACVSPVQASPSRRKPSDVLSPRTSTCSCRWRMPLPP